MGVVIYKNTDGSAPTLTGQNDKLRQLLLAVLVNGYGAKAAAGWAETFSGTNKAVFRQAAGNQFYLRVQDDGPGSQGAQEARLRGAETATDEDLTGDAAFPTAAQLSAGIIARKSASADGTTRAWTCAADDRTVIFSAYTADTFGGNASWVSFYFGDIVSVVSADAYRTMLIGGETEGSAHGDHLSTFNTLGNTVPAHYLARAYTGAGASILVGKHGDRYKGVSTDIMIGSVTYPNPADGGLYLSPVWVHEGSTIRGRLRGLWQLLHAVGSVNDGDTFSGTGPLAGKTFLCLKPGIGWNASDSYQATTVLVLETSDTWETN